MGIQTVDPHHELDDTVKQAKTLQSLFAVAFALVLNRQHRCIEDHFAVRQINSMLQNVLSALRLVPSDHYLIVYIKRYDSQGMSEQ